jgi:hypothetical protein
MLRHLYDGSASVSPECDSASVVASPIYTHIRFQNLKCKTKPLTLAELDVVVPEDNCTIQRRITGLPREHADFHPEHSENVCVYKLGKPLPRRCRIQESSGTTTSNSARVRGLVLHFRSR